MAQFQQLVEEREQLTNASIERQQEVAEHDLVIKTLDPLDADRKCFRLVGEVLVERTVADVLPAVKKNRENLSTVSREMPCTMRVASRPCVPGRRLALMLGCGPRLSLPCSW